MLWLDLFFIGFSEDRGYLVTVYMNDLNLEGMRNKAGLSLIEKHWLLVLILKGECGGMVSSFLCCSIRVTK